MIMVSEIAGLSVTHQARPSWGNADNFSALLSRREVPAEGLLRKFTERLRGQRG